MFKVKQYVNHRCSGVCVIKEISSLSNGNDSPLYYVLNPLYGEDKGSVLRVLTTNSTSLKDILSKKEMMKILNSIHLKDVFYIDDTKLRKNTFESTIGSGDLAKIFSLYAGVKRKKELEGRLSILDAQFYKKAEPIIYGNIATSLGIPYEEVEKYLSKTIK